HRTVFKSVFQSAVMAHHDITRLMSFDRGFDSYPGIKRLA
ncbi:hypothetical protein ABLN67_07125, partial [Mycobacterium tuberculosis]